jgi:hypothetical protein
VAAIVLSHPRPPAGDPGDPTGDHRLARDGAAALTARLGDVPIGLLGHGATRIEPAIDWPALAGR